MTRVAVVGAGRMGSAMVRKLRDSGVEVDIWNRSSDRANALAHETGAVAHAKVSTAVESASVIMSTLASGAITEEVFLADSVQQSVHPTAILCDMGTSGVATAARLAETYGDRFVDSPVSGSVPAVMGGTLLVLGSGSQDAVDVAAEPMSSFAKKVAYLGPAGHGQMMKLALNLIVHTLNSAIAEGLALAVESGIDVESAYQVLCDSSVAAPYVLYKQGAFTSAADPVAMAVDLVAKDVSLISQLANECGLDLRVLRAVGEEVDAARQAGFGAADMADLLPFVRGRSAPTRP